VDSGGQESHASNSAQGFAYPNLTFMLRQNYPNPFNSTTTIQYEIPPNGENLYKVTSYVSITAYDILGREVATLVEGEEPPGDHSAIFDGRDLSSGIYFIRMQVGGYQYTIKLLLIK